ncbi:hypothetical protein F511_26810 [Dorcoceras hygrometricum]|uniref:Dystroglycan-like n=1 Tax=Dorcoceras hygrometricum TaxID=472368 RepID=A0A2Z7C724_9LAMI|nr:hypothetical protein F511_26810 [Dorcoceras hygrometricum]
MASSLISNSHHIDFDAVFGMEDTDLVQMFESLIATGLKNFLGCPAVFNEDALTEFFANSSVREDGLVVNTINGVSVEISEEVFAATFELPVEGLTDLSNVPKNLVFDARSLFSISKEQVSMSCLKKAMKIQYRLLHDILAKTIYVKAGSFDSVTRDRFMLMTAITFDVKINWSSLLFGVLREMVTPGSRLTKESRIWSWTGLANLPQSTEKRRVLETPVGARHKCQTVFAATFELPVEGLTDLSDVPKNLVFDARSLFSISKEQVSMSCLKKAMKIQYRLLHDILAKTIYVKAGSFDSVTRDRFMLMTAITFDVKINWSSLLFGVLREMFDLGPVVSTNALEEQLYYVEIPESPPPIPQRQESSSSSSDSQMNFDTTDFPLDDTTETHTSLPAAPVDLSPLLDDLKTSLSQCVDTAHSDILSRLRIVEQGFQITLGHQNDYLRSLIQGA